MDLYKNCDKKMSVYPRPTYLPIFNEINYPIESGNQQNDTFNNLLATNATITNLAIPPNSVGNILQCDIDGYMRYRVPIGSRTVHVRQDADNNSPYESTTVSGALIKVQNLIPYPNTSNPCEILIAPGTFTENDQLSVPEGLYVAIRGSPQYSVSIITLAQALPAGEAFLKIENGLCELTDFYIDSADLADYTISVNNAAIFEGGVSCDIHRVWMNHALTACLFINNGVAYAFSAVYSLSLDQPHAVLCQGADGAYYGYSSSVYPDDSNTNSIYHRSTDFAFVSENDDITDGSLNSIFLKCDNNGRGALASINIVNFGTALVMETGGTITTTGCRFEDNTNITNAFDSTCFWTSNADQIDYSALSHENYNTNNTQALFNDQLINNRATHFIGRLAVGFRGSENDSSIFAGQGYNDVDHVSFLKYNGVSFTDVTADLKPSGNIPTTLFNVLALNSAFYIGDDTPQKFSSIVFDITTAITGSNIVLEYWNGASWASLNFMFSKTNTPYQPYASSMFSVAEVQTCRTDITLIQSTNWPTTTVNGIVAYWIRFRLTGVITVSPVINNILIYGNMTNITADGLLIHHGKARTSRNIPFDYNLTLGNPTNQTMYYSTNILIDRQNNSFSNAGTQFISFAFSCPTDLDSSCPLSLRIQFCSSTTTAAQGVFSFTLYIASVPESTLYQTSAPVATTLPGETNVTFNLTPNATNGRFMVFGKSTDFYLPLITNSNSTGGTTNMIIGKLLRNNGLNTASTVVAQIGLYYTSYRSTQIFID